MASTSNQRRPLTFHNLDDAVREAGLLLEYGYTQAGNWSLAQCCDHLSAWLRLPLDGFPRQPAPVRAMLWCFKHAFGKRMLTRWLADNAMPAGKPTLRETVSVSAGDDREAVARFRESVARFKSHTGPLDPSPLFGELDRESATRLQLIHCALHLGFLIPKHS